MRSVRRASGFVQTPYLVINSPPRMARGDYTFPIRSYPPRSLVEIGPELVRLLNADTEPQERQRQVLLALTMAELLAEDVETVVRRAARHPHR